MSPHVGVRVVTQVRLGWGIVLLHFGSGQNQRGSAVRLKIEMNSNLVSHIIFCDYRIRGYF